MPESNSGLPAGGRYWQCELTSSATVEARKCRKNWVFSKLCRARCAHGDRLVLVRARVIVGMGRGGVGQSPRFDQESTSKVAYGAL
jgi:hypothetical protein